MRASRFSHCLSPPWLEKQVLCTFLVSSGDHVKEATDPTSLSEKQPVRNHILSNLAGKNEQQWFRSLPKGQENIKWTRRRQK